MSVRVRYTKWGGRPHWEFDARLLGADEWGRWLYSPAGTDFTRPGVDFTLRVGQVLLVSPALAWTPTFFALGEPGGDALDFAIYVDMTTPPVWDSARSVTMVDLDLDVVRLRSGAVVVLDEDEFADHRIRYGYPDGICRLATATCLEVAAAIEANDEPYASVGWNWLAQA